MSRSRPSTAVAVPYCLTSPRIEIAAPGSSGSGAAGAAPATGADEERVTERQSAPVSWVARSGRDAVEDQGQGPVVGVDADRALQRLQRARDAGSVVGLQLEQRLAL